LKERDFSHLNQFPGEIGNPFDIVLHRLEALQRIPWPIFAFLLLAIAALASWFNVVTGSILWGFFLLDYFLLSMLAKVGISYGPAKPPVLILAVLRALFVVLPFALFLPLQITGTILVIYSFWIEPRRLTVTYQKLTSDKFRSNRPLRLLHLGDLHIERITARENQLTGLIQDLKPDIILFSGDILNLSYLHDAKAWEAARIIISHWQAPLGTYLVTGSPAVDLPEIMPDLVKDLDIHWLKNSKVTIEFEGGSFDLAGLTCSHRPTIDGPLLENLVTEKTDRFTIFLYHSPDLAPVAARLGVDLQLSGHTHGGQVRLPWIGALFTGSLYGKEFEAGRMKLNGMTLYITRGIGLEGAAAPRLRLLCPPEIILWEISASPTNGENKHKES
jgi:predicted MPP superfamily phosphohydrolase